MKAAIWAARLVSVNKIFDGTVRQRLFHYGLEKTASIIKHASVIFFCSVLDFGVAHSSAALNTCNNATGECRANVVTVYSVGNQGFVVLAGHLIPTMCTQAAWGYYWSLNLTDVAERARYTTALSAYLTREDRRVAASWVIFGQMIGD